MSIWPQAMSKARPSRLVDRVKAGDPELGGRVGGGVRPRHLRGDRAVVDDAAAARALALHQRHRLPRAQKGAGEVGVDHHAPLIDVQLVGRHCSGVCAGVVEQQVEPAVILPDPVEQRRDRVGVRDVRGHGDRPVGALRLLGGVLERAGPPARQVDSVAVRAERQRRGAPDPAAGAGHERDRAAHGRLPWARFTEPRRCSTLFGTLAPARPAPATLPSPGWLPGASEC